MSTAQQNPKDILATSHNEGFLGSEHLARLHGFKHMMPDNCHSLITVIGCGITWKTIFSCPPQIVVSCNFQYIYCRNIMHIEEGILQITNWRDSCAESWWCVLWYTCTRRTSTAGRVRGSRAMFNNFLCIRTSSARSVLTSKA